MKKTTLILVVTVISLIASVFLTGCNQYHYVYLRSDSYLPDIQKAASSGYHGKSVVLGDIYNRAANTYITGYYSGAGLMIDESKLVYETGIVESYFWYCMQKALNQAGITVYTVDQARPGLPVISLVLNSVSDTEFRFTMQFAKTGRPVYEHEFTVSAGPPPKGNASDETLMQWSYQTMNKAVEAILKDPGLKRLSWVKSAVVPRGWLSGDGERQYEKASIVRPLSLPAFRNYRNRPKGGPVNGRLFVIGLQFRLPEGDACLV